jgi:hypothetical protein
MAISTEPVISKPVIPGPQPWDPHCPACLSGFGPTDPGDPVIVIAQPASAE